MIRFPKSPLQRQWIQRYSTQKDRNSEKSLELGSKLPSITSRSSLTKVLGKGTGFADYRISKLNGGNGGDGAISFQKAPAQEIGPPAGGNGGRGGDVYITASKNYTSLNLIQDSYNVENGR